VIAEPLRRRSRVLSFQRLEEVGHRLRLVSGFVEDAGANGIGLGLVIAGVLEHHAAGAELNAHLRKLADAAASGGAEDGTAPAAATVVPYSH